MSALESFESFLNYPWVSHCWVRVVQITASGIPGPSRLRWSLELAFLEAQSYLNLGLSLVHLDRNSSGELYDISTLSLTGVPSLRSVRLPRPDSCGRRCLATVCSPLHGSLVQEVGKDAMLAPNGEGPVCAKAPEPRG